ncbi:hypothetical protein F5B21DRAFT_208736 [Xylaria acuta]|nr:hypothetical protein F5B21DRAFT_208736 [Xylaria acuta]
MPSWPRGFASHRVRRLPLTLEALGEKKKWGCSGNHDIGLVFCHIISRSLSAAYLGLAELWGFGTVSSEIPNLCMVRKCCLCALDCMETDIYCNDSMTPLYAPTRSSKPHGHDDGGISDEDEFAEGSDKDDLADGSDALCIPCDIDLEALKVHMAHINTSDANGLEHRISNALTSAQHDSLIFTAEDEAVPAPPTTADDSPCKS